MPGTSPRRRAASWRLRVGFLLGVALLLVATALVVPLRAQDRSVPSLPSLPSELVPLLERQDEQRGFDRDSDRDDRRDTQVIRPSTGPQEPVELSSLERSFSERAGSPLRLIGQRAFGSGRSVTLRQTGAAPDGYVLGTGDELVIVLRGQVSRTVRTRVGRDGSVVVADLPPIPAAGVRLGTFRETLQAQIESTYSATEAFVNLGAVRQISVLVNGEVGNPGAVDLNSLASVVDAIHIAGGIRSTGSLRNIQVLRGGDVVGFDLYDLVLGRLGAQRDYGIADGDRIFVPVIGATVAVAGEVKRPGIFELSAGAGGAAASEMLELAGGTTGRGPFSYQVMRRLADGREDLVEIRSPADQPLRDGDILLVQPVASAPVGRVELAGHVRTPRTYPLSSARSVRQLLRGPGALLPDPYLPFAVVQSDSPSAARQFRAFDLGAVLGGGTDVRLGDDDKLYVLGFDHLAFLGSEGVGEALRGEVARDLRTCAGIQSLARWIRSNPRSELAAGRFNRAARDLAGGPERCPELFADVPELLVFIMQNAVLVRGNVLRPGIYPVAEPGRAEAALAAAGARGGSGVDLVGASGGARQGGVVVVDEPSVSLHGHVRFPGTRSLKSTPTLRDLIGDLSVYRDEPYLLFGVISRVDPRTLTRRLLLFNPADVMAGRTDEPLADRDEVQVFGYSEVRRTLAEQDDAPRDRNARDRARGRELAGDDGDRDRGRIGRETQASGRAGDRDYPRADDRRLPDRDRATDRRDDADRLARGGAWQNGDAFTGTDAATRRRPLSDVPRDGLLAELGLRRLMLDNAVAVVGGVNVPGDYPVAGSVTLEDVIRAAGGLTRQADASAVELTWFTASAGDSRQTPQRTTVDLNRTSPATVRAPVGSIVRVNPAVSGREDGFILVEGQVQRPGRYDLIVGERLSSVISRAGGLRANAYPYGAVFTRASVQQAEFDARQRALAELNRALVRESTADDENRLRPEGLGVLRDLVAQIESSEPIGRMVIEADPNILLAKPELDITVEPGDRLFIPRRPWSVFVSGEVFNPGAQQFGEALTARNYLQAAGGITADADRSRMFIVAPDGSAAQFSASSWRGRAPVLAPGSAIIVPRDLRPFDPMRFSLNLTQILSSLAISAGALAVISNN